MRSYYNQRVGHDGEPPRLTLHEVRAQIGAAHDFLDQQAYLQKSFGYYCVDAGHVAGDHGIDLRTHFYLDTGIRIESSVRGFLEGADEVTLFTVIEFLHDHTAKPDERSGWYHSFSGCGWHFDRIKGSFDIDSARQEWREKVNRFLKFYGDGYELSVDGEIVRLVPDGLQELVQAKVPSATGMTNTEKVRNAVRNFRLARSSREQRKQALRELADVLEFYRPEAKKHLRKGDAADLFNIANNFAIRHHNQVQKDKYEEPFLTWIFYSYLATVRLLLELVHGPAENDAEPIAHSAKPVAETDDDDVPF